MSRVAKALELACSLGFPKILLNMDMATTLATETQKHLGGKTTAGTASLTGPGAADNGRGHGCTHVHPIIFAS